MRLQLSTWPEVEAYLARCRGILMPIGSTEQHGPTGVLGTDAITAETIAWAAGAETGALVGPTLGVGMAQHHMAFPGTVTLRPSTLILVLRDVVLSLAEHGFERFLFINGHGGNVPSLGAAFYEIHAEQRRSRGAQAPELRCRSVNWYEGTDTRKLTVELYGSRDGSHATASEIAVTQHVHREAIKQAPLEPRQAPQARFHDHRDFRRRHPDGRMGSDPSLARPEHGARLVEAAARDVARVWHAFLEED